MQGWSFQCTDVSETTQGTWARDLVCFIDVKKAFDTVPRELLWKALRKLGCPDGLCELIEALHRKVTVQLRDGDKLWSGTRGN